MLNKEKKLFKQLCICIKVVLQSFIHKVDLGLYIYIKCDFADGSDTDSGCLVWFESGHRGLMAPVHHNYLLCWLLGYYVMYIFCF